MRRIPVKDPKHKGPIQPDHVRDLESKAPNIVDFFRKVVEGGTAEAQEATQYVNRYVELEKAIREALSEQLPESLILSIILELKEPKFQRAIRECITRPGSDNEIRKYVLAYFKAKGIHFKFKEPE